MYMIIASFLITGIRNLLIFVKEKYPRNDIIVFDALKSLTACTNVLKSFTAFVTILTNLIIDYQNNLILKNVNCIF